MSAPFRCECEHVALVRSSRLLLFVCVVFAGLMGSIANADVAYQRYPNSGITVGADVLGIREYPLGAHTSFSVWGGGGVLLDPFAYGVSVAMEARHYLNTAFDGVHVGAYVGAAWMVQDTLDNKEYAEDGRRNRSDQKDSFGVTPGIRLGSAVGSRWRSEVYVTLSAPVILYPEDAKESGIVLTFGYRFGYRWIAGSRL